MKYKCYFPESSGLHFFISTEILVNFFHRSESGEGSCNSTNTSGFQMKQHN